MSGEGENDWVFDYVMNVLKSPQWDAAVMNFIDTNCLVFDNEDENKFVYTDIHKEFIELVENLLNNALSEVGITTDDFIEVCNSTTKSKKSRDLNRTIIQKIVSLEDFLTFKKLMVRRNMELELEAMREFQKIQEGMKRKKNENNTKDGNDEDSFSYDDNDDGIDDDNITDDSDDDFNDDDFDGMINHTKINQNIDSVLKGGTDDQIEKAISESLMEMEIIQKQEEMEQLELEQAIALSLQLEEERLRMAEKEAKKKDNESTNVNNNKSEENEIFDLSDDSSDSDESKSENKNNYNDNNDSKNNSKYDDDNLDSKTNDNDDDIDEEERKRRKKEKKRKKKEKKRKKKEKRRLEREATEKEMKFLMEKQNSMNAFQKKPLPNIHKAKENLNNMNQQAQDIYDRNKELLNNQKKNTAKIRSKANISEEEMKKRAEHLREQRNRILQKKREERERKIQMEMKKNKNESKNNNIPQVPDFSSFTNNPNINNENSKTEDEIIQEKRRAMRIALARNMKRDMIEQEEQRLIKMQMDQFSQLDEKLKLVEDLRRQNQQREQELASAIREQQRERARNIQRSSTNRQLGSNDYDI